MKKGCASMQLINEYNYGGIHEAGITAIYERRKELIRWKFPFIVKITHFEVYFWPKYALKDPYDVINEWIMLKLQSNL